MVPLVNKVLKSEALKSGAHYVGSQYDSKNFVEN